MIRTPSARPAAAPLPGQKSCAPHQPLVPPEVTWPPPLDCTGAEVGAWRLLDEFEEFEEFDELDEFEELEEPDESEELVPESSEPPVAAALELLELPEVVAVWCVEPGSAAATAPAATTLAKPTVAVVAFSLRLPRSRSATARARAASRPDRGWP